MGQFAAQAHAYSHISDNPDGLPGTAQGCRACLSFAPLESAVGGSPAAIIVARCEAEAFLPSEPILVAQGSSHRAFQSRAPPALL